MFRMIDFLQISEFRLNSRINAVVMYPTIDRIDKCYEHRKLRETLLNLIQTLACYHQSTDTRIRIM